MEALGASHLKLCVSGRRERERLGFVVRRKGVGGGGLVSFRANCLAASISSPSSSQVIIDRSFSFNFLIYEDPFFLVVVIMNLFRLEICGFKLKIRS